MRKAPKGRRKPARQACPALVSGLRGPESVASHAFGPVAVQDADGDPVRANVESEVVAARDILKRRDMQGLWRGNPSHRR